MKDIALISAMLIYKDKGIKEFLKEIKTTINTSQDIVPMISLLLDIFNIMDDKKDKGILLEFIQEYLNILKRKNMEE